MEFDQRINGIRGSFRYSRNMQLLVWVLKWSEQQKKNAVDSPDITLSERVRESNICKPSILAKKQPHSTHLVYCFHDPSCPHCQGGSIVLMLPQHEGSRVGP